MLPNKWEVKEINPSLQVSLCTPPAEGIPDPEFAEKNFRRIQKEKPIFDGTLLCLRTLTEDHISAYPLSFKEYLACSQLKKNSAHAPLAVSGWIIHRRRILIGLRSDEVHTYSRYFELVPSGGIDSKVIRNQTVCYQQALLNELEEETGIPKEQVLRTEPHFILYSPKDHLYDICMFIEIRPEVSLPCDLSSHEYQHLLWVPMQELKAFVKERRDRFVPTSLAILELKIFPDL